MELNSLSQEEKAYWDMLYTQYYPILFRYCMSELAYNEDAANESTHLVFEAALQKIELLHSHSNVGGWLMRAAKLEISKFNRLQNRAFHLLKTIADIIPVDTTVNDSQIESQIDEDALLVYLRAEERRLYEMHYIEQASTKETAAFFNMSEAAIRKRISRLRLEIQRFFRL